MAAVARRRPQRTRPHLGHGVRDRRGKSRTPEDRHVGKVVAHARGLAPRDRSLLDQPLDDGQLLPAGTFVARDAELFGTLMVGGRFAAAHEDHIDAGPDQHLDAELVGDLEALHLDLAAVLRRAEIDAAVGQHAIDVEDDEADGLRDIDRNRLRHARSGRRARAPPPPPRRGARELPA
jgi:hypothetical protein